MSLPPKLYEVFKLDEGARPGICFEGLSSNEVIKIYGHIKENISVIAPDCIVWSNKLETDVALNSFENPAVELTTGEICQFLHYLADYSYEDCFVNNISIYVFPDSIELFYDVRDIHSKYEIEQILLLTKRIFSMCSKCTIFFAEEDGTPREGAYQELLREFVNA